MDYGCLVLIVDFLNSTTCLNGDRSPIKTKGKHAVFRIQTQVYFFLYLDLYSQCRFGCKYPKLTDNYDKIALKKIIYFDLIPNYDLGYPEELTLVRYLMHSAHCTLHSMYCQHDGIRSSNPCVAGNRSFRVLPLSYLPSSPMLAELA